MRLFAYILLGMYPVLYAFSEQEPSQNNIQAVLERNGIPVDSVKSKEMYEAAVIKAIDAGGGILKIDEAVTNLIYSNFVERCESVLENILYIKMKSIAPGSAVELAEKISQPGNNISGGLIIDLRDTEGDSIEDLKKISSIFIPEGTRIFGIYDLEGKLISIEAAQRSPVYEKVVPVKKFLLVNEKTQRCAEVLAGILQTDKTVIIIGSETKGDYFVRAFLPYDGDKLLHVKTRKIEWTGKPLKGVKPEIELDPKSSGRTEEIPPEYSNMAVKSRKSLDYIRLISKDNTLRFAVDLAISSRQLRRNESSAASTNSISLAPGR